MSDKTYDDTAVDRFAAAMKAKLAKKRAEGRSGWQFCQDDLLSRLLIEHIDKGDPIDVANFAMMIHQRGGRITQRHSLAGRIEALEAELSRVKAERDEAMATVGRLRGTLEYIKAQSVSKAYASTPAMALNVIRANAEAALDGDFQAAVDAARSFLTRMENQKAENAPCGECRLQPGETCDICGRSQP